MGYCEKSGPANMAADCFWPFRREGCPDFGDRYLLWCSTNPNDGIISAVYFYPPWAWVGNVYYFPPAM